MKITTQKYTINIGYSTEDYTEIDNGKMYRNIRVQIKFTEYTATFNWSMKLYEDGKRKWIDFTKTKFSYIGIIELS